MHYKAKKIIQRGVITEKETLWICFFKPLQRYIKFQKVRISLAV